MPFEPNGPFFVGRGTLDQCGPGPGRRHSGLAWLLLSLLPGPFTTLLIVILGPVSRR